MITKILCQHFYPHIFCIVESDILGSHASSNRTSSGNFASLRIMVGPMAMAPSFVPDKQLGNNIVGDYACIVASNYSLHSHLVNFESLP